MANGEITGPPAVDFYSMLSGLGNTIRKTQQENAIRDARQAALTPGPDGTIDFHKGLTGLVAAGDLQGAQVLAAQQAHQDALARQATEDARQAARDKINDQHWAASYALQKRAADRADETPLDKANERAAALKANNIDPTSPEGQSYILTGTYSPANKPIPVETLGGTKFLVRGPNGYTMLDPSNLNPNPAAGAPPAAPQASPASPTMASAAPQSGTFADRFSAASPQSVAPAAPAQPADLTAVDPQTGRRENWLKAQSPDVQAYIKKIADYEIDPRTTSIKGGHREQVLSAVAQYDPTYDQNTFSSRAKAIKDFATGQQGNAIRSFDVATDHLDTLQKYTNALKNGDVRMINALRNKWLTETGSDLPTNFQAVAPIVGAEVSKAIIGSNNALADREELRKPLENANSPDQISGAIQGYKTLMTGQLRGLKKQYEDTTGRKDFNNRLRQSTKDVLLGGEGGSSVPPPPKWGELRDGYRYKGGNPADPASWVKAQ